MSVDPEVVVDEHRRLLQLIDLVGRSPNGGTSASDDSNVIRLQLVEMLNRHYVRLWKTLDPEPNPSVERALHELRCAHVCASTLEPIDEVGAILEQHVKTCPLAREPLRSWQSQ